MELKDIIYENLNRIIHGITTNGENFEEYYNDLDNDDKKSDLFALAEEVESKLKEVKKSKLEGGIHSDFGDLLGFLDKFWIKFSDYPNHRIHECIVIIYLVNLLNESIDEETSLDEEYDISQLSLTKIEKEIYQRNFAYFDSSNLKNSIVLLDFSEPSRIATYFSQNSIPKDLIVQLLANIGIEANRLELTQYVLSNKDIEGKKSQ